MSMESLKCSANSCAHNQDCVCYAGGIQVSGASATAKTETHCSTYSEKVPGSFTNCASGNPTVPNSIKCDACNCGHNSDKFCTASNVQIDAYNGCCDTFTCS